MISNGATFADGLEPGSVPLSVFRSIARTLHFFRRRLIAVSLMSGTLRMEGTDFRHPEISVQTSAEHLQLFGAEPIKPQNL